VPIWNGSPSGPSRISFALQDHQGLACDHPALPLMVAGVSGLWRARLRSLRREPGTPVQDACLALHAVDPATTKSPERVLVGRGFKDAVIIHGAVKEITASR
jgi:hypothetical protein